MPGQIGSRISVTWLQPNCLGTMRFDLGRLLPRRQLTVAGRLGVRAAPRRMTDAKPMSQAAATQ